MFLRRNMQSYYNVNIDGFVYYVKDYFNEKGISLDTEIRIIDSHSARPYYDNKSNTIVIDKHFFDIAFVIVNALYTENYGAMQALAYSCAADYFICKDTVYVAREYAKKFASKKTIIKEFLETGEVDYNEFFRMLLFIICHEQGHALISQDKEYDSFQLYKELFNQELDRINSITKYILSIDLSPIKKDLDELDDSWKDTNDFSIEYIEKVKTYSISLMKIIDKGMKLIDFPEHPFMDKETALSHACDYYIKGGNQKILDQDQYEEDATVDGFAMELVASCPINNENIVERLKKATFTYYACMLTMNAITCMNACVMNYQEEGYKEEDLVYNRMRLEREIFNAVLQKEASVVPFYYYVEHEVIEYAKELIHRYDRLYAIFCDVAYALDHPDENTRECYYGMDGYDELYDEIRELLSV